jgi:hypothetical protein
MYGTEKYIKWAGEIIGEAQTALEKEYKELESRPEFNDKDFQYTWKVVSEEVKDIIESESAFYVVEKRGLCKNLLARAQDYYEVIKEARKLIRKGEVTKESLESAIRFHNEVLRMVVNCENMDGIRRKIKNCEFAIWAIENPL